MHVVAADGELAERARALLVEAWGPTMARLGRLVDVTDLPVLVALDDDEIVGVLAWQLVDTAYEVAAFHSFPPGRGAGRLLLDAAREHARACGAEKLWLITTNDNTSALRFYQRNGLDLVRLHHDAVTRSRASLKPTIPLVGFDGIEIRHELELEQRL